MSRRGERKRSLWVDVAGRNRHRRRGRVAFGLAVVTVIVALVTILWGALGPVSAPLGIAFAAPQEGESGAEVSTREATYRDVTRMLRRQRPGADVSYLTTWSESRLSRLQKWLELGVRFEGPWESEELTLVLEILDAYGDTFGEERFIEIAGYAVTTRSDGWRGNLRLVKASGNAIPAAAWFPTAGRIVLNDGLFDDAFVQEYYYWHFLTSPHTHPTRDVRMQEVVIGHELGHVVIDGLRAEAAASESERVSLEQFYSEIVPSEQWPHGTASTNENMATEIGVWALGIPRTSEVQTFRMLVMTPTVREEAWTQRVQNTLNLKVEAR